MSVYQLRDPQKKILDYRGGKMGVSAVPGSGKTWTLSLLAAEIISSGKLGDDQEVLIVTLVNSAVDNFYQRVSAFIRERGLLPNLGYRVRTLHGLAHDIVRERPSLVGLSDNFQIIDEREADAIRKDAAQNWLYAHPFDLDSYLNPELDENRQDWVRRDQLPQLANDIALAIIRYAKDRQWTPEKLRRRLDELPVPLPLAEMGAAMYADYQRALNYRGALDFDDLIRLALQALQSDEDYLARLREQWPYILEDEAQDSSRLQEEILSALAGPVGNWVRVGDPNQAIYETFTTANPKYLREFIERAEVRREELPHSGRSTYSIINLANYLVDWTMTQHPVEAVRDALQAPPWIEPTEDGDPQPNPPDEADQIYLVMNKLTPQEEILAVADSLARWLPENPDATVAVLAPRNTRAFELVNVLKARDIPYDDSMLRSSSSTRFSAGVLGNLLSYLSDPQSPSKLARVYVVWRREERDDPEAQPRLERVRKLIGKIGRVEDFLWPGAERDWLDEVVLPNEPAEVYEQLLEFRTLVRRWQEATVLPVDQIVLTLAQDLLSDSTELAISHRLAVLLRRASEANPDWRLPELTNELALIAKNERRFLGLSEQDTGFDPEQHKGEVVVSTMHKAKGLEWNRVYLMSVNTYDFPSGMVHDTYISEKWYIRDRLNLQAEALAQLEALFSRGEYEWYQEGAATQEARLDYVRERLRLLYVGLTRAKRQLIVTWNAGRGKVPQTPALPLIELNNFWEEIYHDAAG